MAGFTDVISVIINAQSAGAVQELDKLQKGAKKTDTAFDTLGKRIGITGQSLKAGLAAGATALIGTGLVKFLNDSATAYAEAAKGAGELALATGGSVENVSRLQAALEDAGVSADKSAGMLTKFTTQSGKNKALLDELGVTLKTGADGTTDYTDAMVQAVDAINKIGDSSKRNQALVKLFGKQGAAAFNELLASGVSLEEAMRRISRSRVFDDSDVRRAQQYDDAIDSFNASMSGLGNTIGRMVLPLLSLGADGLTILVDVVSSAVGVFGSLPGPVQAATIALAAFTVVTKTGLAAAAFEAAATGVLAFTYAAGVMGGVLPLVTGAMKAFTASLLTNPITAVAVAIAAVVTIAASAAEHKRAEMEKNVQRVKELEAEGKSRAEAVDLVARATADNLKGRKAVSDGFNNSDNIRRQKEALDEATTAFDNNTSAAQENAEAQGSLKELIEQYIESGGTQVELLGQIDEAARGAAEAKGLDAQSTALAKEAMEKYDTSIQGVIERLKGMDPFGSKIEDLAGKLQNALDGDPNTSMLDKISDNVGTWADETKQHADEARQAILDAMAEAAEHDPDFNPLTFLDNVEEEVPQAKGTIDGLRAELAANPMATPWKLEPEPGTVEAAQGALDILKQPVTTSITFNTDFADGGYNAVKARKDYLANEVKGKIDLTTVFNPDGYNALKDRKDYLAQNVTGTVNINTIFSPDGYGALKDRKDYLAQNRTAYIDIVVRGVSQARRTIDGIAPQATAGQQSTTAAQPVTNNWSVTVNGAADPRAVVRALDRYVRNNGRAASVVVRA